LGDRLDVSGCSDGHFQNSRLARSREKNPGLVDFVVGVCVTAATAVEPADGDTSGWYPGSPG
jgi:hypothetical protein